jgi:presenilin-like A22 family membrane protease
MPDYQKMYLLLFNELYDVIEHLKEAMLKTEELYMDAEEPLLIVLPEHDELPTETNDAK